MAIQAPTKIQILAPEILSGIFQYCVPEDDRRRSTRWLSHAPLLLGRVCSRWRTVSLSTPDLWSSFAIGESPPVLAADCRKDLEATRVLILRSASRPLSILIHYGGTYSDSDVLPGLFDIIVSQAWRWKEIKMTVPADFENILLAPFYTGSLPQLVIFDSMILRVGVGSVTDHSIHLYSAPRLQRFHHSTSAEGVQIDFCGRIHDIRSVELNLSENPISLGDLFTCLTQCPLLTKLESSIGDSPQTSLPRELPAAIELQHLRDFNLSLSFGIDPCHLFDRLFLPALTDLILRMDLHHHNYTDWPHLLTMLEHSRPPLQNLILCYIPIAEATLIECLSYTPSLVALTFDGIECTDSTLESLTLDGTDTSRSLCPCLEDVEFGVASSFSARAMIALILSRRSSANPTGSTMGTALKSVDCNSSIIREIQSNPDIVKCMEDGLGLFTTSYSSIRNVF